MYDVGGQRDQRNKWIQVFEGIQAVLFLISCSEFDQNLREDPTQNRLQEALKLFRAVWQNRFLASAGLIVFLNKYDIMERKIRAGKHIVDYFPEYEDFCKSRSRTIALTRATGRRCSSSRNWWTSPRNHSSATRGTTWIWEPRKGSATTTSPSPPIRAASVMSSATSRR